MNDTTAYTSSLDCVHCGLCLPSCPTYDVLGTETDSPRGRIYLMRALLEGNIADPESIRPHLDGCLDCRACETVCPSGVQYGSLLETVRARFERECGRRTLAARVRRMLLLHLLPHPRRLRTAFRLARMAQVLRLDRLAARLRLLPAGMALVRPVIPPARERRPLYGTWEPAGKPRARLGLLTGCVMEQLFGGINRTTIEVLVANGFAVEVPRDQACCGALLIHDGLADRARQLAERNVRAFADVDWVVHNSAGCGAAMREYGELCGHEAAAELAGRSRDVCELLAEHGLTAEPGPFPHTVAYDDPCHLGHAQGVRDAPRQLLRAVPGLQLVDHPDADHCCGSAGIYNLVHPETAEPIGARKARALVATGADAVVTGNPGCTMQIRAHLDAIGNPIPIYHPIELLRPPRTPTNP